MNRHNLRAIWAQSDPGWRQKRPGFVDYMSDDEIEAFMKALDEL